MAKAVIAIVSTCLCLAACNRPPEAGTAKNAAASVQGSPLFSADFQTVCSGRALPTAAAYVRGSTSHKAVYFRTYRDQLGDASHELPSDWTHSILRSGQRPVCSSVCRSCGLRRPDALADGERLPSGRWGNGKLDQRDVRPHFTRGSNRQDIGAKNGRCVSEIARITPAREP